MAGIKELMGQFSIRNLPGLAYRLVLSRLPGGAVVSGAFIGRLAGVSKTAASLAKYGPYFVAGVGVGKYAATSVKPELYDPANEAFDTVLDYAGFDILHFREWQSDGGLLKADGKAEKYHVGQRIEDFAAVQPHPSVKFSNDPVILINGMNQDIDKHLEVSRKLADHLGAPVLPVHNSSFTLVGDAVQSALDRVGQLLQDKAMSFLGAMERGGAKIPPKAWNALWPLLATGTTDDAVVTAAGLIYERLKEGRSPQVMGYSQGTIITARALLRAMALLVIRDGNTVTEAAERLRNVRVTTMAQATPKFPDGPQYSEIVNGYDFVTRMFGNNHGWNPNADETRFFEKQDVGALQFVKRVHDIDMFIPLVPSGDYSPSKQVTNARGELVPSYDNGDGVRISDKMK